MILGFNVQLIESVCLPGVCVILGFNVQLIESVCLQECVSSWGLTFS